MLFSKQLKVRRHAGRPRLPGLGVANQSRSTSGSAWAALCNRMPASVHRRDVRPQSEDRLIAAFATGASG